MRMRATTVSGLVMCLVLLAGACTDSGTSDTEADPADAGVGVDTDAAADTDEVVSDQAVTIAYWHTMSDAETAQLETVVAAFEAANPDVAVETTRYAYDDFKSALLTSLAGREGPDLARLDIIWVPEFAERGALLALDEALEGFDAIAASTFPGPLATNYWDGHHYGLPQNTNTQVLLWHGDRFAEAGLDAPPSTMEEYAEAVCALSDPDAERYGAAMGGTYFWAPAPIFYAMGGQVVDDDVSTATGYINGPESVAAFELMTGLYEDGCLSPSLLGGGIGTADGHADGTYATIIDGPWMVDIYADSAPDLDVNFALIPAGPDGTTSSVVGGENVVVFADTEHQDAATRWAAFLLSEESQRIMAEVGVMPTLPALADDPAMPEYFDVFLKQLETAQARVPHPAWSDMDAAISEAFQRMLQGDQSVQEALDQAADEIDRLLQ